MDLPSAEILKPPEFKLAVSLKASETLQPSESVSEGTKELKVKSASDISACEDQVNELWSPSSAMT